jgi:hypothetical protein
MYGLLATLEQSGNNSGGLSFRQTTSEALGTGFHNVNRAALQIFGV